MLGSGTSVALLMLYSSCVKGIYIKREKGKRFNGGVSLFYQHYFLFLSN